MWWIVSIILLIVGAWKIYAKFVRSKKKKMSLEEREHKADKALWDVLHENDKGTLIYLGLDPDEPPEKPKPKPPKNITSGVPKKSRPPPPPNVNRKHRGTGFPRHRKPKERCMVCSKKILGNKYAGPTKGRYLCHKCKMRIHQCAFCGTWTISQYKVSTNATVFCSNKCQDEKKTLDKITGVSHIASVDGKIPVFTGDDFN